jgi:hypothetical protein
MCRRSPHHFPPSHAGRRCQVTATGTVYPGLHRVVPLSSSTDSSEPRGPRSPPAASILHLRATRPSQAAIGELYRCFATPSSGHQVQPSRRCPALVHRCAGASRRSSASLHHQSPISAASATVACEAATAAVALLCSWAATRNQPGGMWKVFPIF